MPVPPPSARAHAAPCLHCGTPIPEGGTRGDFCCAGCEAVYAMLRDQKLTRYYDLAGSRLVPVADPPHDRSFAWLEPLLADAARSGGPVCRLDLDVQGIHCAACVWLMNELFRREGGGVSIVVNPALGKASLSFRKDGFDVARFVREVERFGYLFGPSRKSAGKASWDLPLRLGVCAAATMNVMLFSVSFYTGLAPADGDLFTLFTRLDLLLSAVVVAVGGWPFFAAAWRGLVRGLLHLDLPIALGILLAFGASLVQARSGRGDRAYLDTLDVFVTLMLVGRWLEQRLLEKNRRFLLQDDGADGLLLRRREGEKLTLVRAPEVRAGDLLVVAPSDLVPVDSELLDLEASFSTDWISGEARVSDLARGERVRAGSFNAGRAAALVRATTDFADSPLPALLSASPPGASSSPRHARFFDAFVRRYVLFVLGAAALGLAVWWPHGPARAVDVTVALLVVTCPCAIGIAIPLAYELVQARLRRAGLFVRSADLLDRLARVRKVLFDKTGTLTLARLELADPRVARALPDDVRDAAYDMAARSNHPVSRCLAAALAAAGAGFSATAEVVESPGDGLSLDRGEHTYRLGRAAWAAPGDGGDGGDTVLSLDGRAVVVFATRHSVRADGRREIDALARAGFEVWILSGDDPGRVAATAHDLGLDPARALGGQRPEDKAAVVARLDQADTLFLGDGVNDALAFERAFCAGTPAIDRPVMPAKADFFLLGEGIAPVREALALSVALRAVVRRILAIALTYNLVAVAACLAGLMTPLVAAVAMPASSLSLLVFTARSLASKRPRPVAPRSSGRGAMVPA